MERMAKVIDRDHNPTLGEALDTASAAVLFASLGAAVVGVIIFFSRVFEYAEYRLIHFKKVRNSMAKMRSHYADFSIKQAGKTA